MVSTLQHRSFTMVSGVTMTSSSFSSIEWIAGSLELSPSVAKFEHRISSNRQNNCSKPIRTTQSQDATQLMIQHNKITVRSQDN